MKIVNLLTGTQEDMILGISILESKHSLSRIKEFINSYIIGVACYYVNNKMKIYNFSKHISSFIYTSIYYNNEDS